MIIDGEVGIEQLADGASPKSFRYDRQKGLMVSELNPVLLEQAYRGNVFFCAQQAATAFAANGITTVSAVGLCVYNPPNSGKNIIPLRTELVMTNFVTTSTDVQVVAVVSTYSALVPATATVLVTYKANTGAGVPSGSVATACVSLTFAAAPVVYKPIYSAFITTTLASAIPTPSIALYNFNGGLMLPPGTGIALISNNASTGIASMDWLELPV